MLFENQIFCFTEKNLNHLYPAYFSYLIFGFESMVNTGKMYQQSHLKTYTLWYTIKIAGSPSELYNILGYPSHSSIPKLYYSRSEILL